MRRGTTHTPEARAKMSASRKGKPLSPQHCAAIAEALRNRTQDPEANARRAETMQAYWHAKRMTE